MRRWRSGANHSQTEMQTGATAAAQLERAMTTVVHALSDLARVRPSASVIRNPVLQGLDAGGAFAHLADNAC